MRLCCAVEGAIGDMLRTVSGFHYHFGWQTPERSRAGKPHRRDESKDVVGISANAPSSNSRAFAQASSGMGRRNVFGGLCISAPFPVICQQAVVVGQGS